MDITQYASSVVSRTLELSESNSSGVSSIATIIAALIPTLLELPCLKDRTNKREFVEEHPTLSMLRVAKEIRQKSLAEGSDMARKKARELANTLIEDYLSSSDETIRSMGLSV